MKSITHHIKITLKYLHFAALVALLIIALLVITMAIQQDSTPYKLFLVRSGSMAPTIPAGSLLLTQTKSTYNPGDILTFRVPPATGEEEGAVTVTHRLTSIEAGDSGPAYYTKGDANISPDAFTTPHHRVIGKTIMHLPFIGYLITFARTPIGVASVILIPGLFIIAQELRHIATYFKNSRQATTPTLLMLAVTVATLTIPSTESRFTDTKSIPNNKIISRVAVASPPPASPAVAPQERRRDSKPQQQRAEVPVRRTDESRALSRRSLGEGGSLRTKEELEGVRRDQHEILATPFTQSLKKQNNNNGQNQATPDQTKEKREKIEQPPAPRPLLTPAPDQLQSPTSSLPTNPKPEQPQTPPPRQIKSGAIHDHERTVQKLLRHQ